MLSQLLLYKNSFYISYIDVNTGERKKNYHTLSKCSNIHCCIGKVFYLLRVQTYMHINNTAHLISWGESSFQVHTVYSTSWWMKLPVSVFNQDNRNIYPSKLLMWTCAHSPGLVTWPDAQWQRLRRPGCWRWKTLCWTPWRTRFWRCMAFRVVCCRSIQVRPFGTKLSGAAWAKALSWETEDAAARPEELLVWFWGSGLNTLKTPAGVWVCEARESVSSSTDWILQAHKTEEFSSLTRLQSPCLQLHPHVEDRLSIELQFDLGYCSLLKLLLWT